MEKGWAPLSECYHFKSGLMDHALWRYPWEDDEYEFDFSSYYPPIPYELASIRKLLDSFNKYGPLFPEDIRNCPFCRLYPDPNTQDPTPVGSFGTWDYETIPLGVDILSDPVWDMDPVPCPDHIMEHLWPLDTPIPALVTPIQLENTKKYLNQVRNSRGYDVDCVPHGLLVHSQFFTFDLTREEECRGLKDTMKGYLDSTINIQLKSEKVYQVEDFLKIVRTRGRRVFLVTFTAKVKNDDSAACDTFIATIHPPDNLIECMLKPDCNAPGPDNYPDFIIHPIQLPNFVMMRPLFDEAAWEPSKKPLPLVGCFSSKKRKQHHSATTAEDMLTDDTTAEDMLTDEAEPLQTLPTAVEENRDEGSGDAQHIPSPLI